MPTAKSQRDEAENRHEGKIEGEKWTATAGHDRLINFWKDLDNFIYEAN